MSIMYTVYYEYNIAFISDVQKWFCDWLDILCGLFQFLDSYK